MKNSTVWAGLSLVSIFTILCAPLRAGVVATCDEAGLRAAMAGGGVVTFDCDGTITLSQTLDISQNVALDGTGHTVTLSGGGAVQVLNVSSGVNFAITNITIADGFVSGDAPMSVAAGGGFFNGGVSTVVNCTFTNNLATNGQGFAFGGGIYDEGTLIALGCTFANNACSAQGLFPGAGGGIASGWLEGASGWSGPMFITNCTFFGNTSYAPDGGYAGGVQSLDGDAPTRIPNDPVLIVNCTFASNSTYNVGGASNAPVTLINTILLNPPGKNTLGIIDGGYNLSSDTGAGLTNAGSIGGVDPLLGPLAFNGGPTETMVLLTGSPAIDAGNDAAAPPTDQRGVNRPQGFHSDIGAYESSASGAGGTLGLARTNIQVLETAGTIVLTVNRTGGSDGSATVDFSTSDGTAIAGQNYVATNGQISFEPSQLSAQFSVPVLDNPAVQGNLSFNVSLANAVGASLGTASAAVVVQDVDTGVAFATNFVTTNISAGNALITVLRTGSTNGSVSVNFATSDRTAIAGRDYSAASGVLDFAAGQTNATISVPILNNGLPGPDKAFWVALSDPSGASLLTPSLVAVVIVNNNTPQPGALAFLNSSLSVSGAAASATVTVVRSGGADGAVSVFYATSDGSAHAPADYGATSGILTFADQQTAASFVIPLTVESGPGQKTINLALFNATRGASLGVPATAIVTISYGAQVLTGNDELAFRNAVIAGGVVTFSNDATITLTSQLIVPAGVRIDGSGHNVTISGGGEVGIFKLNAGVTLALNKLAIVNGRALGATGAGPGGPGTGAQPGGPGVGGAVVDTSATLVATSCVFSNNQAVGGTGGAGPFVFDEPGGIACGGCIYNANGLIVATNCLFEGNGAVGGSVGTGGEEGNEGANGPAAQGGALYSSNGTALLVGCIVSSNFASAGDGVYAAPGGLAEGGGIYLAGGSFTLLGGAAVSNSCESPAISSAFGGGVCQSSGNLVITNFLFDGNWARGGGAYFSPPYGYSAGGTGLGGGLSVSSGSANVSATTFVNNSAFGGYGGGAFGGAVYNNGEFLALNCTLALNSAEGGAVASGPTYSSGGAIFNSGLGIATLDELTIASNTATVNGAPGSPFSGGVDSTNIAGMVLQNTILAFNAPQNYNGILLDDGNNLSSDDSPAFTSSGSIGSTDPLLGALADNGGPTPTMALASNSPAIDHANSVFLPPFDQRGYPRPSGLAGDIGAFEYQSTSSSGPSVSGMVLGLWPGDVAQIQAGSTLVSATNGAFTVSPESVPFVVSPINENYVFSPSSQDVTTNQVSVIFQAYHKNAFTCGALANGSLTLTLAGTNGQSFVVEVSSNIIQWVPVSTNAVGATGMVQFPIGVTNTPRLFYRAVTSE